MIVIWIRDRRHVGMIPRIGLAFTRENVSSAPQWRPRWIRFTHARSGRSGVQGVANNDGSAGMRLGLPKFQAGIDASLFEDREAWVS